MNQGPWQQSKSFAGNLDSSRRKIKYLFMRVKRVLKGEFSKLIEEKNVFGSMPYFK